MEESRDVRRLRRADDDVPLSPAGIDGQSAARPRASRPWPFARAELTAEVPALVLEAGPWPDDASLARMGRGATGAAGGRAERGIDSRFP